MLALKKIGNAAAAVLLVMLALMQGAYASEIDLKVPSLDVGYNIWGYAITGSQILMYGIGICEWCSAFMSLSESKKCRLTNRC